MAWSWNQKFENGWRNCQAQTLPGRRFYIDLLAGRGVLLSEPHTRQLDGKFRELRFYLEHGTVRVTYRITSGRRIILLTVFRKSRMREDREIRRARRALERCIAERHIVNEGAER
ncbi:MULTISPECIES: type II toxin-antitoxin system RelE/ParE family toxin [unclassified Micromonospora]|uniref:type II toxin-antitoxin system RelE/ParE family toxin n=1 Tax=unclassified Micromonospora TaxID=2617518 RepID=UPI00197CA90A|nr:MULTISPECIES: type II toxin-antitoxin system RelE/ParE family toxin [unclassified Micromonospora]